MMGDAILYFVAGALAICLIIIVAFMVLFIRDLFKTLLRK